MAESSRSVTARDITGSSVVTGDRNMVMIVGQSALPPADKVDVKVEIKELRELLARLKGVPDRGKLDRAMEDVVEEVGKAEPDKDEVAHALERAIKYGKAADDFDDHAEYLLPRIVSLASWVGAPGRGLLAMIGVLI
jgi:hypothetical protein